jgi:hypothetical protein
MGWSLHPKHGLVAAALTVPAVPARADEEPQEKKAEFAPMHNRRRPEVGMLLYPGLTLMDLLGPQGLRISLGRLGAVGRNSPLLLCSPAGWESDASCTIDRQDNPTASGTSAP